MSWFDRNPIFKARRLSKCAVMPKAASSPASRNTDDLAGVVGDVLLGRTESVQDRRRREASVHFHDGISGSPYGSASAPQDVLKRDVTRDFLIRIRNLRI